MKKLFTVLVLSSFALLTWHCSNAPKEQEQTAERTPVPPNKKREKAPLIKVLREFKISPEDSIGYLTKEVFYNEKGLQIKSQAYNFYGTGEKEGLVTWEYNDKGHCIKSVTVFDGEVTNYTYKNDEQGNKISEEWSRKNGLHDKSEYVYKDGKLVEEKFFNDDNGTYENSNFYEYVKDEKGRLKTEKRVSKPSDGSAPVVDYQTDYTYLDNDSVKEKIYNNGAVNPRTVYTYDEAGNAIQETEYEGDSISTVIQTWFNEYGEYILDSLWTGNKQTYQLRNVYSYDKYGNDIFHMYSHSDGDAWGSRYEIEYY